MLFCTREERENNMELMVQGEKKVFEQGTNALDILRGLPGDVKKTALAARLNGELVELATPLHEDGVLEFIGFDTDDGRHVLRHTASHVLAAAVKNVVPGVKLAIGPAIDNGFYYDFDVDEPFTPEILQKVEKEMARIIKKNEREVRFTLPRDEAIAYMREIGEPYKVELIEDLPEDEIISFYRQGDGFVDLCAGPHLPSTGGIKAFKLTSVAGAYWRGSEKNKMLQRIYGTAFTSKQDLEDYLQRLEEAKKRDHRKLGRELDLFDLMDEGPGFPFFYPKGMYTLKIDDEDYAIKPMNCPGGILAYKRRMWSYRDLPVRVGELGQVHRHEKSGALHGLMRVRCFTQDDAHLYMTPEQIKQEIIGVYKLTDQVYRDFGFPYKVELSTRPEENTIGTDEMWELSTQALKDALDELGAEYTINEGDGAFYGPKIDFHLQDSLGRSWQCGTLQLDMNLPERFDMEYVGADGERHRPVMIHRTVLGSLERFMAILTEHFGGAFPVWLAPVQASILTITDRADEAANALRQKMEDAGLRTEADLRNEKIGFKVREAQMQKVPYMLVIGDREAQEGTVSVRTRKGENLGVMTQDALIAALQKENAARALERNWQTEQEQA